jgi:hypothetical protein
MPAAGAVWVCAADVIAALRCVCVPAQCLRSWRLTRRRMHVVLCSCALLMWLLCCAVLVCMCSA